MAFGDILVRVMIGLQALATLAYAGGGRWPQALYWLGATVITCAVLWQSR